MAEIEEILDKLQELVEEAINVTLDSDEQSFLWECHDWITGFREGLRVKTEELIAEG